MKKILSFLLPIAIVIVAVVLYIFIPAIQEWVLRMSEGWKGALVLLAAGVLLGGYYVVVMGFRGRAMRYAIAVIIFTMVCIWLIANWEWFTTLLESHLGVWGMSGVLLLLCAIVGVCMWWLF